MKILPILLSSLCLGSLGFEDARSNPINQAWLFSEKHPEEAERYLHFSPVSQKWIEDSAEWVSGIISGILDVVEKRIDDPDALREFIKQERSIDYREIFSMADEGFIDHLQTEDQIFYFDYRDGDYRDDGILVIRDGEIVYRRPFNILHEGSPLQRFSIDSLTPASDDNEGTEPDDARNGGNAPGEERSP